jgi:DNA-binding NtrC family response regulator
MPGMSGAELISQAEKIRPKLKALMMTGYPDADELAQLPPDTPVLIKPFRRAELIDGVRSLLGEMQVAPN